MAKILGLDLGTNSVGVDKGNKKALCVSVRAQDAKTDENDHPLPV